MLSAYYSIEFEDDNVISITQQGFWNVATAIKFTEEAKPMIATAQLRGVLRLVIDLSDFQVPSANVSDILSQFDRHIRREGDRVAIVVASSLLKMQMMRQVDTPGLEFFISKNAALTWAKSVG